MRRISIIVYDERYKVIFKVTKAELTKGIFQLSSYVSSKLGVPMKVITTPPNNSKTCWVCGRAIKKGTGMRYQEHPIHQACLMKARQKV